MTTAKLDWWDAANDRRQFLICKKWSNQTVTDAECLELLMLQKLAEMVMQHDTDLLILAASKSEHDRTQEKKEQS